MAWYITGHHRHRRQQRRQFRLALGLLLLCWAGLSWLIWELLPLDDGYVSRWAASPKTKSSSAASHDTDHRPAPPAARAYPSESLRTLLGALAPYPLATANESQAGEVPPTCELVHFQLLARDGTHYPSAIEQADFDALETALRVHASAEWPAWLREWQSPAYPPEQLTGQGRQELAQLAQRDVKRYRRWLHSLAYERHRNAWYASAAMPRATDSAQAYASAFSGRRLSQESLRATPLKEDTELAPLSACPRVQTKHPEAARTLEEHRTKHMPAIQASLSKRLGFTPTEKLVRGMARACAAEFTHHSNATQWCRFLEPQAVDGPRPSDPATLLRPSTNAVGPLTYFARQRNVDAFYEGLQPSSKPVSRLLCALFSRILAEMTAHVEGRPAPMGRLRFTTLETFLPALAFLGIDRDRPTLDPLHDYRLSQIAPFAANLHIELLRCGASQTYSVRVLRNEQPVSIHGCSNTTTKLCTWPEFKQVLESRIGRCNHATLCQNLFDPAASAFELD